MQKLVQHYLVLNSDLNHFGNLGGFVPLKEADITGVICATLAFPKASFVTRHFESFDFINPLVLGDIMAITAEIVKVGTTSVTVAISAINIRTKANIFATSAVYVNAPNGVKAPIPTN